MNSSETGIMTQVSPDELLTRFLSPISGVILFSDRNPSPPSHWDIEQVSSAIA